MAKFKIEWSERAKEDLFDILEYYSIRNGNKKYSIKLFNKLNKSIKALAINPNIGISTEYNSVRIILKDNYQIIYEIIDFSILIIMIWDTRRKESQRQIENRII